jgi:hypothetical protein
MGQITLEQAIGKLKEAGIYAARGYPYSRQPNITGVRVAVNVQKVEPRKSVYVAAVCQQYKRGVSGCEDTAAQVAEAWTNAGGVCSYGAAQLDKKSGLYILEVLGVWEEPQENKEET